MRTVALLLACLACAGYGQQVQEDPVVDSEKPEKSEQVRALATLLLAAEQAGAFNAAGAFPSASAGRSGRGAVMGPTTDLLGRPMPMEYWTEAQKRRHAKAEKAKIKDPRDMTPEEMQECLEAMRLDNLKPCPGSHQKKKRKGRGQGSGYGTTCGYGNRGQKSRSGKTSAYTGFEGGQTPLYRRLPKYVGRATGPGHHKEIFSLMKLTALNKCHDGETIDFQKLYRRRLCGKENRQRYIYKVVANGKEFFNTKNLVVKAHAFTMDAKTAIEGNGGRCVFLAKGSDKEIPMPEKYTEEYRKEKREKDREWKARVAEAAAERTAEYQASKGK
mmetsp:Transcript_34201/g.59551  ORF Transcript_34201/g.59551 Transcript_34201/m.59551 type:complete len:330 (-) Transcript_34201:135-1124(-)